MNAEISETIKATLLGLWIPAISEQWKFILVGCHAHSSAHKPPKTVVPTVLMLE